MVCPDIGIMFRVFTNGPGDLDSILGRVLPKIQKLVLDAPLPKIQHYKVKQSRESSSAPPYTLV